MGRMAAYEELLDRYFVALTAENQPLSAELLAQVRAWPAKNTEMAARQCEAEIGFLHLQLDDAPESETLWASLHGQIEILRELMTRRDLSIYRYSRLLLQHAM